MDRIKNLIIGFVLVSLIAAAGAIALSDFKSNEKQKDTTTVINESITDGASLSSAGELYSSTSACRNSSGTTNTIGATCNISSTGTVSLDGVNFSSGIGYIDYVHYTPTNFLNITNNGLIAVDNATSYFGTAGTIAGVALLLTIVIGAFYFVTKQGA